MPAPKVNELRFVALLPYVLANEKRSPRVYTMNVYGAGLDAEDGLYAYTHRLRDKVTMKVAKNLIHNLSWEKHVLRQYKDLPTPRAFSLVPSHGWFLGLWRGETGWKVIRVMSRPDWDIDQTLELYAAVGGCASV